MFFKFVLRLTDEKSLVFLFTKDTQRPSYNINAKDFPKNDTK